MKITVVGFWGAYPEENEATSCYLLEKDGFKLLIDCGSGALNQLPKYVDPFDLDALILSHYHQDHIADVGVLQYQFLVQNGIRDQKKKLPIFGHTEDLESFDKLDHEYTFSKAYDPAAKLRIGPFEIQFLKTIHPVVCYAMRITDGNHVITYTADSSFTEKFIEFSRDSDLLITDCNFYEGQDGSQAGHMNSTECGLLAKKANVETLILSHHPHFGDRSKLLEETSKHFPGNIELAYAGLAKTFS